MLPFFCARSAPRHVDAVISTEQWGVLQNSVEPSLRIRNATDGQNRPFGGRVIWGSVVAFSSGALDRGLRYSDMILLTSRRPLPGESNSHTTPMSQRFYRPVYLVSFSWENMCFWSHE